MMLPRHPLLRALLVLGGLLFVFATLFVGLALGAAVLLWRLLRGARPAVRVGRRAAPWAVFRRPQAAGGDVVEGQAREIAQTQ